MDWKKSVSLTVQFKATMQNFRAGTQTFSLYFCDSIFKQNAILRNALNKVNKKSPYKVDHYSPNQCVSVLIFSHHITVQHNGRESVLNQKPQHCLPNRLFRRRSKKTSNLRVTGLCVGNSPGTGEFPAQMASNAENVSIWWRHNEAEGIPSEPTQLSSSTVHGRLVTQRSLNFYINRSPWSIKGTTEENTECKKFYLINYWS